MTFQDELTTLASEINRLAWEKRRQQWTLDLPQRPPPGQPPDVGIEAWVNVECDFAPVINEFLGRFLVFGEGDPDTFQSMLDGMGDPEQLQVPESLDNVTEGSGQEPPPPPDGYLTVAQNIQAVWDGDIPAAKGLMGGWHGAPSEFMARLESRAGSEERVVERQLTYLAELGAITNAYQEILRSARVDILEIGERTTQKLEDLYSGGWDGSGGAIDLTLTVASVAATLTSASPWVSAAITLGGYFHGLTDAAPESCHYEEWSIRGGTVEEVIGSANGAITKLFELILDQEQPIIDALEADLPQTEGEAREQLQLSADGDPMTSDTSEYSAPQNDKVHLVYRDLYVAGYVYFSSAAYHYQAAAGRLRLSTARDHTAFGPWFARSRPNWDLFRDHLETVLRSNRDFLADSGDGLAAAAEDYANSDAEIASAFEDILTEGGDDVLSVDELQEETVSLNELDELAPRFPTTAGQQR